MNQAILLSNQCKIGLLCNTYLVKVIEGCSELIQLFLRDALSVSSQDVILDLVDVPPDSCKQLLPSYAYRLE